MIQISIIWLTILSCSIKTERFNHCLGDNRCLSLFYPFTVRTDFYTFLLSLPPMHSQAMIGSKTLQQIDRELIHLLQERIALLQSSSFPSLNEQIEAVRPLLKEANISELTWQTLIVNCMAALASTTATSQPTLSDCRRITVVGGKGVMGRFFVDRFVAAGHEVQVLEYDDWERADMLLKGADLVLIAVPLKHTVAVIRRVASYLSPHTILADIASTKTKAVQAMMDAHPGPVVGLHPMFGPGGSSFLGQKVVVCPGRNLPQCQWLLDLIEADGGNLISSTPEEHDAMMVTVQAIRFFANFSLGTFLAKDGVDIERSFEFSSPLYRSEVNTVSRLVAQDAALYVDILLASQERCAAIERLVETYSHLAQLLKQGDRAGLIAEFEQTREFFQVGAERSLSESNYMLNHLSSFLAAKTVELAQPQTCQQLQPLISLEIAA
jgi:prephenate dehydrogenase